MVYVILVENESMHRLYCSVAYHHDYGSATDWIVHICQVFRDQDGQRATKRTKRQEQKLCLEIKTNIEDEKVHHPQMNEGNGVVLQIQVQKR